MFSKLTPFATLPVKDLARAREFYESTLGLTGVDQADGVRYDCGGSGIFVYPSSYAGTNKATAVAFAIGRAEFDSTVSALRDRGVTFQTFSAPGLEWNEDVAMLGELKAVWFSDPDSNIISLETM